jgi:hypothetical protein
MKLTKPGELRSFAAYPRCSTDLNMTGRDGNPIVKKLFDRVAGLPCWNVENGYGSWLDFDFGRPSLSVHEYGPPAKRRRIATVRGRHRLWIEMCDWTIMLGRKRLAHSESAAATIAKAARLLNGQVLVSVHVRSSPAWTRFPFDLGGEMIVRRYSDWSADEDLWHFYSGATSMHLRADGTVLKGGTNYWLSNKAMQLTGGTSRRKRAHSRARRHLSAARS